MIITQESNKQSYCHLNYKEAKQAIKHVTLTLEGIDTLGGKSEHFVLAYEIKLKSYLQRIDYRKLGLEQTLGKMGGAAWYCGLHDCLPLQGSAAQILLRASLLVLFFVIIITCVY